MLAKFKKISLLIIGYLLGAQSILAQEVFRVDEFSIDGPAKGTSFSELVYGKLGAAFTSLYYLLVAIALLMIIIGIVRYFAPGGKEDEKRSATIFLLTWGLIAFVVLISVVPILGIVMSSFNMNFV